MIPLKFQLFRRQNISFFFSLITLITLLFGYLLPLPAFFRLPLIILPFLGLLLWFNIWQSLWGSVWVFMMLFVVILSQFYHNPFSPALLVFHTLFLLGIIYFYDSRKTEDRLVHQRHIKAMRVLLQQNPPLRQTVDYSREAIMVLDNTGHILESNPQVSLLLSLAEAVLVGQRASDILGLSINFQAANVPEKGEFSWRAPNNEVRYLQYRTRPLLDYSSPSGTLLILYDISEEKKRSEAYLQAAKFSIVGQVSAGLAHEIRNPLTTVKGFMQLITPEQWPESFRPYQQLILDEIQNIDQLLNHFVLLTSPSAPQMKKLNLGNIINASTKIIQPLCLMQEVTLCVDITSELAEVMGDEEQLLQALLSILNNAIEASPQGGHVTISLTRYQSLFKLSVIDSGAGIPLNLRDRVFDPFFTTKKEGTGLGLTIAQQIILAHHGHLRFSETLPPNGTEVIIDLPNLSGAQALN